MASCQDRATRKVYGKLDHLRGELDELTGAMERAVESDARLQPAIAAWHRCMDDRPPHLRPRAAMLSDLKTRLTALMGPHGNTPDRAALTALQQQERTLAGKDAQCWQRHVQSSYAPIRDEHERAFVQRNWAVLKGLREAYGSG